jgi:hypothetical protein
MQNVREVPHACESLTRHRAAKVQNTMQAPQRHRYCNSLCSKAHCLLRAHHRITWVHTDLKSSCSKSMLEIHAQLVYHARLGSSANTKFGGASGSAPNSECGDCSIIHTFRATSFSRPRVTEGSCKGPQGPDIALGSVHLSAE